VVLLGELVRLLAEVVELVRLAEEGGGGCVSTGEGSVAGAGVAHSYFRHGDVATALNFLGTHILGESS
jgi:predicted membrane protein